MHVPVMIAMSMVSGMLSIFLSWYELSAGFTMR